MLSPQRLIGRLYASYIALFILFFLIGFAIFPPFHNAALQLGMWAMGLFISTYALKKSIHTITGWIFLFQLLFILISTWVNATQYNDLLGFNPQDADFYRSCGEDYGDKPFRTFIVRLAMVFPVVDDWGFPALMWAVYHVFGQELAPWIIRLLNAVVIAWGSLRLYKLSCGFLEKQESKVVALLWGLMPFSVHAAANGTKENIFVFFVISFFYFLQRISEKRTARVIIRLILYCGLLFFFRLATGYAAIISVLIMYLLHKQGVQKNFAFFLTVAGALAVAVFPTALNFIVHQRGFESDFFVDRNDAKAEIVGGVIGFVVNIIASFIGPIPCFISSNTDNLQFMTKYSFTPLVKILTSFFFYYSYVDIIRNKRFGLMPMGVFSVINILILIIAFFGLHVRMHWVHMPLFLIMAYWGYKKYNERKHNVPWYPLYLGFTFILIILYNYR